MKFWGSRVWLSLLFGLFLGTAIYPQVNVENFRKRGLNEGLFHNISLSLGYFDGNIEFTSFKGEYRADVVWGALKGFLITRNQLKQNDGDAYLNRSFTHLRLIQTQASHIDLEGFFQHEYDPFLLLEKRELFGAGVRFPLHLADDGQTSLFLGVGAMLEREETNDLDRGDANRLRSTNYLSYFYSWADPIHVTGTLYYQPNLLDALDFRILFQNELNVVLTEHLAFLFKLVYRFDNKPLGDLRPYDLELTNGIRVNF